MSEIVTEVVSFDFSKGATTRRDPINAAEWVEVTDRGQGSDDHYPFRIRIQKSNIQHEGQVCRITISSVNMGVVNVRPRNDGAVDIYLTEEI